jgi:LAO/AO transport system kinase
VLTYSALTGTGMDVLWQKILDHRTAMNASGESRRGASSR